ncbi:MAG: M28 family peptidase [Elusimicrobiota bacterium]|jgi:hypothetical protein
MISSRGLAAILAVVAFNGLCAAGMKWLVEHDLLHRHWILPSLAALLAYQWALSRLRPWPGLRGTALSLLAFVTGLGVVIYPGILNCNEGCSFRSGCAALLAGLVFWNESLHAEGRFWNRLRCQVAAAGGLLWGLYLILYHRQYTYWMLDIVFFILALGLWLGRSRAVFLIASVGIVVLAGLRNAGNELVVVFLDLGLITALLCGGGDWIEARLSRGAAAKTPSEAGATLRVVVTAGLFLILAVYAAQPAWLMANPEKRRALLESLAPAFPIQDPGTLSPLASRLRAHVQALAGTIGERSVYLPAAQGKARDYIAARFRDAGYLPEFLPYTGRRPMDFLRSEPYVNIEALLKGRVDSQGIWVVGAHYDTAPGTPGADDNASGVAVLLETARLLRERGPVKRETRFAVFDAEEPPSFATRDMGSLRYVDGLKDRGVKVRCMVNLEMLGYFNPKPGSQLFPPFLKLFFPDRGDFAALAGNLRTLGLRRAFARAWAEGSPVALESSTLPFIFSTLAISDQLNFWYAGIPALMLTDTAFFRNPHYHQASDTPEKLDYEKMAAQTEALVRILGSDL